MTSGMARLSRGEWWYKMKRDEEKLDDIASIRGGGETALT
jgi:hypothetical protein